MNKKYDIDTQFKKIANEEIAVPANLSSVTADRILNSPESKKPMLPYVLGFVFLINILISLFFGGVLYLIRPISLLEWVIIGSVYSSVNVLLYGVTFINYEKLKDMLHAYSRGGF